MTRRHEQNRSDESEQAAKELDAVDMNNNEAFELAWAAADRDEVAAPVRTRGEVYKLCWLWFERGRSTATVRDQDFEALSIYINQLCAENARLRSLLEAETAGAAMVRGVSTVAIDLLERRLAETHDLADEILMTIEAAHTVSIGTIDNTYVPQISKSVVKLWRAALTIEPAKDE